jgi:microcystin-dependent protein
MSDPYLGEVRLFAGNYAPEGWNLCDGTLLQISSNEALYAIMGTVYGGNGTTNFAVPDFRGRVPISIGTGNGLTPRVLGVFGGSETVVLAEANLPSHTHNLIATTTNGTISTPTPTGTMILAAPHNTAGNTDLRYIASATAIANTFNLAPTAVADTGQNTPHANIMQSVPLTFIIALAGTFPSPS